MFGTQKVLQKEKEKEKEEEKEEKKKEEVLEWRKTVLCSHVFVSLRPYF